jgi:hypothetical protein
MLGGSGERDVYRFGSGMNTLSMPSDRDLVEQLLIVERNIGDDIGGNPLAFGLPPRWKGLADVSARDKCGDMQAKKYHVDA